MNKTLASIVSAGAIALGGCSGVEFRDSSREVYSSNVESELREGRYSDKDVKLSTSVVRMATGDYIFGRIPENAIVKDRYNQEISKSRLFPFWAVRTNEMTEEYFPESRYVKFGRADGKVRVFVQDSSEPFAYLNTNRGFRADELPEGKFIGNIREPTFSIPRINFNMEGFEAVPYATVKNSRDEPINVLVGNASYLLNHSTGLIEFHGDLFQEVDNANITIPIRPLTEENPLLDYIINAQIVVEPIEMDNSQQ